MMQDDDNDDIDATSNWWGASTLPANAVNDKVETAPILAQEPTTCGRSGGGTPTATPTPVVTATPDPLNDFPLPMIDPSGNNDVTITLPELDFDDRVNNDPPLCARDINVIGGGEHELIVPVDSELIVSDPESTNDNGNLGNFVAVRIPMTNLPINIKQNLEQSISDPATRTLIQQDIGYIYLGYAHLSRLDYQQPQGRNFPTLEAGTVIGRSGKTGIPDEEPHLDLSVFYVSGMYPGDNDAADPIPFPITSNGFFGMFETRETTNEINFGKVELVDAVTLWPVLVDGISQTIDYACP